MSFFGENYAASRILMTSTIGAAKTIILNRPIASGTPQPPSQATPSGSCHSSFRVFTHGRDFTVFFCNIAVSSALNRFVQLDAPFAIILFYLHGLLVFFPL